MRGVAKVQNVRGTYLRRISSWRKMAASAWPAPNSPLIYGKIEVDMTRALAYIADYRAATGRHVTVTHLVVKAVAETLRRHPQCNGMLRGRRIYLRDDVHISLTVAAPRGAGGDGEQKADLSAAMVRHADAKSLSDIASEVGQAAEGVREDRDKYLGSAKRMFDLLPPRILALALKAAVKLEYGFNISLAPLGIPRDPFGSMLITSVAAFDVGEVYAPIPPITGVAVLLSVGAVKPRAVVVDGEVVARPIVRMGATIDHRLIDGYQGGKLAATLSEILENPGAHLGAPPA